MIPAYWSALTLELGPTKRIFPPLPVSFGSMLALCSFVPKWGHNIQVGRVDGAGSGGDDVITHLRDLDDVCRFRLAAGHNHQERQRSNSR